MKTSPLVVILIGMSALAWLIAGLVWMLTNAPGYAVLGLLTSLAAGAIRQLDLPYAADRTVWDEPPLSWFVVSIIVGWGFGCGRSALLAKAGVDLFVIAAYFIAAIVVYFVGRLIISLVQRVGRRLETWATDEGGDSGRPLCTFRDSKFRPFPPRRGR